MYDQQRGIRWDPTIDSRSRCGFLQSEALKYPHLKHFIESGTADGDTVIEMVPYFERLYTIELVPSVYQLTKARFEMSYPTISWFLGDSTDVLPRILTDVKAPCFIWLDGHYCGREEARVPKDTPVKEELETIFRTGLPHVVFVDDARLFGVDPAYPTLDWVRNFAVSQNTHYTFTYINDMMKLAPQWI